MVQGSLAERLRVLRARKGWTLKEAARRAGVGRDTLSDIERGRQHPVMPTLARIAEGYGVPVEELLEESPRPKVQAPHPWDEEERREKTVVEIRYAYMTPEEFDALREEANFGDRNADEFEDEVEAEYNALDPKVPNVIAKDVDPAELEAKELYREARKRWHVVRFDVTEADIAADKLRKASLDEVRREDIRELPLDEAYDVVRQRLGVA